MSASPPAATEKAASAWRNATARLGRVGPELKGWLEGLELLGEMDQQLLLVDRGNEASLCPRCQALLGQALLPLGYAGAKILSAPASSKKERR